MARVNVLLHVLKNMHNINLLGKTVHKKPNNNIANTQREEVSLIKEKLKR